ncbi:hypothetical protein LCGC14_2447190 [marine sediment metagenome]|uniref:Uncharacterized protein n=1 Tax=marine sediment metagenome TaxID=412755 RepID=A0A0F9BHH4_9ZZZZ
MEITKELQQIMDEYGWKSIDDIDWNNISYDYNLSIKFMEKYFDKLNLEYISYYQILSENFIECASYFLEDLLVILTFDLRAKNLEIFQ